MSRIQSTFSALSAQRKKGLITFITAGDPSPQLTVPLMHALVAGGVNILELGVPFSDPMAEGPVIQRACERALKFGVSTRDVLEYVREFRKTDAVTPVVLMGYANPIERFGVDAFIAAAKDAGVDWHHRGGLSAGRMRRICAKNASQRHGSDFPAGADLDRSAYPSGGQGQQRLQLLRLAQGCDGAGNIDTAEVAARIAAIREHVKLPIGVGFGIRDGATARAGG